LASLGLGVLSLVTLCATYATKKGIKRQSDPAATEETASDEVAEDPKKKEKYSLIWQPFFACRKEIGLPDLNRVGEKNIAEIINWTADDEKKRVLQETISKLEANEHEMAHVPNFILGLAVKSATDTKQAFTLNFQETSIYLKGIIALVESESSKEIQERLKSAIVEDLYFAFKECSPTWHRQSQYYFRLLKFRKEMRSQNGEKSELETLKIKMILAQAISDYKEDVVLCARQLENNPKEPIWHYLSYFGERVGDKVGIKLSHDPALEGHHRKFDREGKTNEQLVQWFQNHCSPDNLIDYILEKINSGVIEYKNDNGDHLFLCAIQKELANPDEIENYHESDYRPNRQAVAFLLEKMGLIQPI
jgi:hypothetical protein